MRVRTPKYLHKPFRILWFESDELFMMFLSLVLGIYVSVYFLPALLACVFVARKVKARFPRGFLRHISFFLGITRFRNCPTFFESRFQE